MRKKRKEFSKTLLVQESALIWIMSLAFLALAFYCIHNQYLGSLPWLAAMVGFPWTAYGASQVYYYKKSWAENTQGGIKYQSLVNDMEKAAANYQEPVGINLEEDFSGTDPVGADSSNDCMI